MHSSMRSLIWASMWALATLLFAGCGSFFDRGQSCNVDDDCPAGHICGISGICAPDSTDASDAGEENQDAGPPPQDAGPPPEDAGPPDAGDPPDAGEPPDAGQPPDAGDPPDAGTSLDAAEPQAESGAPGPGDDGGSDQDPEAGPLLDAGPAADAGNLDQGRDGSVGQGGPGEDAGVYANCAQILSDNASAASGIYTVVPGGPAGRPTIQVYCDMDTDEGGWTLLARSADMGMVGTGFGWRSATGAVDNDDDPYSLNATFLAEEFSEILIGIVMSGKTWGGLVFRIPVPMNFVDDHQNSDHILTGEDGGLPGLGLGTSCSPGAGFLDWPDYLSRMGDTAETTLFRFADAPSSSGVGLLPDGWNLSAGDCTTSGGLHGNQGMIMAR
jgi:hypothetical protein